MDLVRGQRVKLADLTSSTTIDVALDMKGAGLTLEILCFGVDAQGKLADPRHVISVTQRSTPCGAVSAQGDVFRIALEKLPESIRKLVFAASITGEGTMGTLGSSQLSVLAGGATVATFRFAGSEFSGEKAILAGELYWKDLWRFAASGQGFQGGREQLFAHFGGTASAHPTTIAPPPPAPPPPPPEPPPPPPPGGGGFMGWVRSMSSGLKDAVARYRNDAFAEAVAAACAMVAAADGTISPEEKQKMIGFIQRSDELKVFEMSDLISRFQRYAGAFEFEPASGRVGALRGVARLKGNDPAAKLLIRVCCAIGAADGTFDDQERSAVRAILTELALDPGEFPDLRQ